MQRRGIFGQTPPMIDHPNGMMNPVGTGAGYPDLTTMPAPQQAPTFKQRLGGFLEGTVNDLMHMRGVQNTALDQRRIADMYKQRQDDELAQYEQQQRIKAQYDKPTPHYWESNDGSLMSIGPDGQPVQVYKDNTPKPYMVTNPDGTITPYIYNGDAKQFERVGVGGPTGAGGTPAKPIGKLTPLGGPTASPSGGFRR